MPTHPPRAMRLRALATEPAAEELITLDNVTLRLRDRRILAGTSWSIRRGEHWAVIGPNGAGKTTLVRALRGEVPAVQGKIFPADPRRLQERVACVSFENHRRLIEQERRQDEARCFSGNSDGATTVRQLLENSSRPLAEAGPELIERFGIGRMLERGIRTLSNGEIRRVLIARVLLAGPEVLVLDEPFDGLDLPARENLAAMIGALMNPAGTVILVTHRLSQIPAQVTHVMGVRAGRVFFQGLRAETITPENIARLYGGHPLGPVPVPLPAACPPIPRGALVEFRNVTVSYGGKPVLKNLNWSMRAGEHWALCGPNGSGKTTVVNLIVGENPQVYANDIRLFGRRRGSGDSIYDIRRRLGFMSCEFHLRHTRRLTAFEVVLSGFFDSVGLYRAADTRQAESGRSLMEALGIGGLADRIFSHLSFGEQRMVLLVRAVVKLPELLVLDEPCQGLDRVNRRRVIAMVDRICRGSATHIIYVTHQPDEIPACITHRLALPPEVAGAAAFSARLG